MSDTKTAASVKRKIEAKTIVKMKAFGDAKFLLAAEAMRLKVQPEAVSRVMAGRIVGIAMRVAVTKYTDPKTQITEELSTLVGSFRAIPIDETRNITTSSKLGISDHIMGPVIDMLLEDDAPQSVSVAWDIGVETSNNPVGYSWFAMPLMDEDANDPVAMLEARLAGKSETKALAAPTDETRASEEAPAPIEPAPEATGNAKHGKHR